MLSLLGRGFLPIVHAALPDVNTAFSGTICSISSSTICPMSSGTIYSICSGRSIPAVAWISAFISEYLSIKVVLTPLRSFSGAGVRQCILFKRSRARSLWVTMVMNERLSQCLLMFSTQVFVSSHM